MDQTVLVGAGHALVRAMEERGTKIRGAMWVTLAETDGWRLWLVGPEKMERKEFYALVAQALPCVVSHYADFSISDVELKTDKDPVIKAMAMLIRADGLNSISLSRNMVNGVYTPDGVMLRMAL